MNGKLIVIEGLDGSGKSTQLARLRDNLGEQNTRYIKFPDYESDSSALVRMYLAGHFGDKPGDVGAYAASAFYAVDRYASYKTDWGKDLADGRVILCDRYATSNAIHQTGKLPENEWADYVDWLYDFEFGKLGLPRPDAVIYLDMPIDVSQRLMSGRYKGDEGKKDIHERDTDYLHHCRKAALFAAERLGWQVVSCAEGNSPRTIDDIAAEVLKLAQSVL
jgi:dTMP kinase